MSDPACLALLLDGPMQSWGFESRFQRRTTGLHPTKSGVTGLLCAAMGLAKGSEEEGRILPELAALKLTSIAIPRDASARIGRIEELAVLRLEDFHTVGGGYTRETQRQFIPRKASGGPCDNPTVSRRQYLNDARFGVILEGARALLERVASSLQDPVWGVWLGRKNCIPSAPVFVGLGESENEAWKAILQKCARSEQTPLRDFTSVTEVSEFDDGTDSLRDQPLSFGDSASCGPDKRRFALRRIALRPATAKT